MKQYKNYKDSGVEFLGKIPEHWEIKRLKDYGKIQNGADYKDIEVEEGGYPVYGTGGIFKRVNQYIHSEASVLLGRKGTIDRPVFVNKPFWTVDTMFYTIVSKNVDTKYFYYLCTQIQFDFFTYGSAIPSMTQKDLHTIPFPFPKKWEQEKIAKYLDQRTAQIDRLIANKKAQIQQLQEIRQIEINQAVTKGLNPEVAMKDSGVEWLGEIPGHWEVKRLKNITNKIVDGAHFTPTYIDKGVPFLRVTDIQTKEIDFDSIKFIPKKEHIELCKRAKAEKGDLLLSKNGTIGLMKVVDWNWEFSFFVSLCLIRFTQEVNPYYFQYFFKSNVVDHQLKASSKKTSVTNLHLEKINLLVIAFPKKEEQKRIIKHLDKKVENINHLIKNLNTQIHQLQEIRKIEIYNAVTGKIKVI